MKHLRRYGRPPFSVVVLHGGPGALGEMAEVARELARDFGVLEPMGAATSIEGQVEELKDILESHAELPVASIGFSWGAWLGLILAAQFPQLVKKLVLVGSGPFEERYAAGIHETRVGRLSPEERTELEEVLRVLRTPDVDDRARAFARYGELFGKADACDPIHGESDDVVFRPDIFESVWPEAANLRRSGELLELVRRIRCPVLAIHGDYDSHPAEGVRIPLSEALGDFRFVLLENCGHMPWIERGARDEFFRVLREELTRGRSEEIYGEKRKS